MWSSEARRIVVGCVGHHARSLLLIVIIVLRSAFPVLISYNVKVLSDPMLARTDDSERLNLTEVIVSVDVGNVRFETAALLSICLLAWLR